MLIFLASLAAAAPLELTLSPGSRVEVLPPLVAGRADVVIYDNRVDVGEQLGALIDTGLTHARSADMLGHWMLTLELADPATTVHAEPVAGGWTLTVVPSPLGSRVPYGPVDLTGALEGRLDPTVCATAPLPLHPLTGSDTRWETAALGATPELPVWSEAEPSVSGWREIDDTRAMTRRPGANAERLEYRLGALHRDLGSAREGAYYFTRAAMRAGPHAAAAWFQAARAQLAIQKWDDAARSAKAAVAAGGSPEYAAVVLGIREWAIAGPDQAGWGRVLAATATSPNAQLVAGVLLSEADCAVEAEQPFTRAVATAAGSRQALARVLLADAILGRGDIDGAAAMLATVDGAKLSLEARRVVRSRARLLAMLRQPAASWPSFLPELARDASLPGAAGEESLYTLAQVRETIGEATEAIDAYAELIRRQPRLATGHVGRELVSNWAARSETLIADGRVLDALGLHRGVWSPALAPHVADLHTLRQIATGYADSGLPERALETWRTVADQERARGLDGRESVVELLRLYVSTGATDDALDAVAWLRHAGLNAADEDTVALLEGDAALQRDDPERARRAWRSVPARSAVRVQANARLALLDAAAGDCVSAIPGLESAASAAPLPDIDDDRVHEALYRCMVATGRAPEAATEARTVAGLAGSDHTASWKTWRAARLSGTDADAPPTLLADAATTNPGIWGALAAEETRHQAFVAAHKPGRRP